MERWAPAAPYDAFVAGWGSLYDPDTNPNGLGDGTPLYSSVLQLGRLPSADLLGEGPNGRH